jgi:hypothetical protein
MPELGFEPKRPSELAVDSSIAVLADTRRRVITRHR